MNQCLIIEVIFLKQLHVFSREVDQVRVKVHTISAPCTDDWPQRPPTSDASAELGSSVSSVSSSLALLAASCSSLPLIAGLRGTGTTGRRTARLW